MNRTIKTGLVALSLALLLRGGLSFAQTQPTNQGGGTANVDLCHQSAAKVGVSIHITGAAATTQIMPAVSGKALQLCGITYDTTGTSPTVALVTGTGTNCGTGTISLSGVMSYVNKVIGFGDSMVAQTPAGNALCLAVTGTTPTVDGMAVYAIQP